MFFAVRTFSKNLTIKSERKTGLKKLNEIAKAKQKNVTKKTELKKLNETRTERNTERILPEPTYQK